MLLYGTFCYHKHILCLKHISFDLFCTIGKKKSFFFVVIKKYLLNSHLINNK